MFSISHRFQGAKQTGCRTITYFACTLCIAFNLIYLILEPTVSYINRLFILVHLPPGVCPMIACSDVMRKRPFLSIKIRCDYVKESIC